LARVQPGLGSDAEDFEFRFAVRYAEAGLRTAFLPDVNCLHLGALRRGVKEGAPEEVREMYRRHGFALSEGIPSAYKLNDTKRAT